MTINITVIPYGRGRFSAHLEERPLCTAIPTPFFSAARALLDEGAPPETPITMSQEGSPTVALRSTVGKAAALTVIENDKEGPRLGRYRPLCIWIGPSGGEVSTLDGDGGCSWYLLAGRI